jgi:hypothetical protein
MNTNSTSINNTRLSSVALDLEAQNDTNVDIQINNIVDRTQLRSGIKVTVTNSDSSITMTILLIFTLVVLIVTPIVTCDLYFGFTDNTCSNIEPEELAISLKLYLLVSGFSTIFNLLCMLTTMLYSSSNNIDSDDGFCALYCSSLIMYIICIFQVIWNILGAVVFWGYIYGDGNCNKQFSTYMFVSLIIKLVSQFISMQQSRKDKK